MFPGVPRHRHHWVTIRRFENKFLLPGHAHPFAHRRLRAYHSRYDLQDREPASDLLLRELHHNDAYQDRGWRVRHNEMHYLGHHLCVAPVPSVGATDRLHAHEHRASYPARWCSQD